jgi:hypothetical protein
VIDKYQRQKTFSFLETGIYRIKPERRDGKPKG